jgi:thiol-disulfide isomerase/thioredoxin
MKRREAVVLGAVGGVALAAGALVGALSVQSTSGAGKLLSATFPDLSGRTRRLADWQGRVVLFNFWATWCAPCREEMPLLDAAGKKFGFPVVGIGIDTAPKIQAFAAKIGVRYEMLVGGAEAIPLMKDLGNSTGGLPFSLILDRSGRVAFRKLGALSVSELEGIVARLLR